MFSFSFPFRRESESAYDNDGTTGILYEDVKEETVGSNQSDDGGSVNQEQGDDNGEGVEGVTVPVCSLFCGNDVKSKVVSTQSGEDTNVNNKDVKSKAASTLSSEDTKVDNTTSSRPKTKNIATPQPSDGATNVSAMALTFAPFQKKVDTMERRMTDTISV